MDEVVDVARGDELCVTGVVELDHILPSHRASKKKQKHLKDVHADQYILAAEEE